MGGAQGRFAAFGPRLRFSEGECACAGSPPGPSVGLLQGGVLGGGGTRFLPPSRDASCRRLSSCFSAVTTGGGTRSLTRYQPRPGGGVDAGTEGEGRTWYSSSGFISRYRPFGATNPKPAPPVPLKCCVWARGRFPARFSDLF